MLSQLRYPPRVPPSDKGPDLDHIDAEDLIYALGGEINFCREKGQFMLIWSLLSYWHPRVATRPRKPRPTRGNQK